LESLNFKRFFWIKVLQTALEKLFGRRDWGNQESGAFAKQIISKSNLRGSGRPSLAQRQARAPRDSRKRKRPARRPAVSA
jgi:hypothetical protein